MSTVQDTALYLEGGAYWIGTGFGASLARGGELVFNTGMTGYQEIYTDPSYTQQVVVLTGSEVGNTGVNTKDMESQKVHVSAVVVRNYCHIPSNWRANGSLSDYLKHHEIPGIFGVDTREITQVIRDKGATRCIVFPTNGADRATIEEMGRTLLSEVPSMNGLELVSRASCSKPYDYVGGLGKSAPLAVIYDYGVKANILGEITRRGFRIRVVPYDFPAEEVLSLEPQSVVLSNGPGDPAAVRGSVERIQEILGKVPLLAICMGHQLLARALGCKTYKLKFGHHGINHPVQDLHNRKVLITSQNHGFAVDESDLIKAGIEVSHKSLNDGCVEGYRSEKLRFVSVQFHPEASPGPRDAAVIFDQFVKGFIR